MDVILLGKRVFADVIKDFEIIWVGSMSSGRCPYDNGDMSGAESVHDTASGQRMPRSECSPLPGAQRGGAVWTHGYLDFTPLASRMQRALISVILSCPVFGDLLQQPYETNTEGFLVVIRGWDVIRQLGNTAYKLYLACTSLFAEASAVRVSLGV